MKIALSGGITGGHVYPALRVGLALQKLGNEVIFIGSKGSLEESTCRSFNFPFASINLSRHASPGSRDVIEATREALQILSHRKPDRVFLKGDITSVPVAIAASKLGIKTILHESDSIPGSETLAMHRLCTNVCAGYVELQNFLPESVFTGVVGGCFGMMPRLKNISKTFRKKPVLYITGGSQGSEWINSMVSSNIDLLLSKFDIIHQCGVGKRECISSRQGYQQWEHLSTELPRVYEAADYAVSRAGATTIHELAFNGIPTLLIPLPSAEFDHQTSNAKIAESKGIALVLNQEGSTRYDFKDSIATLVERETALRHALSKEVMPDGLERVLYLLLDT